MNSYYISILYSILGVVTPCICKFLYDRNTIHAKTIKTFKLKLSQEHNKARKLTNEECDDYTFFPSKFADRLIVVDIDAHKTTINSNDIDVFFNTLSDLNKHSFVFFKKHYCELTEDLKKCKYAISENGNCELILLQTILESDMCKIEFLDILWFRLAFKGRYIKYMHKFKLLMYKISNNVWWIR